MDDPSSLRRKAVRCRRLLAEITDIEAREALSRLADEYEQRSRSRRPKA